MPFTFSHPGFTLPFKKWKPDWFSSTGFFFGSIAPDMDIILRLTNQRFHIFNYDLFCVLVFIFPIALLFSIYFHVVLRNVIIDHLPGTLSARYASYKSFNYLAYLKRRGHIVVISILLSIYLHLFLDMISHFDATTFQHYGGVMYLSRFVASAFFYGAIYLPAILLSFIGFYLILKLTQLRIIDLYRSAVGLFSEPEKMSFYLILAGIALAIAAIKSLVGVIEKAFIFDIIIINLTNGFLLSGVITPTLFYIRNKIKKVS